MLWQKIRHGINSQNQIWLFEVALRLSQNCAFVQSLYWIVIRRECDCCDTWNVIDDQPVIMRTKIMMTLRTMLTCNRWGQCNEDKDNDDIEDNIEPVTGEDGLQVVNVLLLRRQQLFQDLFPSAKISSTLNFDHHFYSILNWFE